MFLYPVGFLIVIMLGAIAVDLSNVWLQQRQLADAADAAANDAATYGVAPADLRAGERAADAGRVDDIVRVSVTGQHLPDGSRIAAVDHAAMSPAGNPAVSVTLAGEATFIFGRLAGRGAIAIQATGMAELSDGG
jgi:uncharacterized membrane protein